MNCHYVIAARFCLESSGLPPSILFCSLLESVGVAGTPFGHIREVHFIHLGSCFITFVPL